jgi:hypothetical protein
MNATLTISVNQVTFAGGKAPGALHKAGENGVLESGNEKAPEGKITDKGNQNKNLGGPFRSRPAPMLPGEGAPFSLAKPGLMQHTEKRRCP